MQVRFLFSLLVLLSTFCNAWAARIEGQVTLNNEWQPMVYLSLIDSFTDLNTAAYDFLIAEAPLDASGNFVFEDLELPDNYQMYRLHVVKNGDPISTIFIGGQEENFLHFLMKDSNALSITTNPTIPLFQDATIIGEDANTALQNVFALQKKLQRRSELASAQSRELLKEQVILDYKDIVRDNNENNLNRLLAAYYLDQLISGDQSLNEFAFLEKNLNKADLDSSYYNEFSQQLSYLQVNHGNGNTIMAEPKNAKWPWLLLLLSLAVIVLFRKQLTARFKKKGPVVSLSVQERKVLELLKSGKSNKEISNDLHIEISTVKSHVHRIYNKLGVRSRKELVE